MTDEAYDEDDEIRRLDFAAWFKLGRFALPHRSALAGLMSAGLVLAISESLLPMITARIVDDALSDSGGDKLVLLGSLYAGLVLFNAILIWFFINAGGIAATGIANNVRRALFDHLQTLSFSFYDKNPVGWLMARVTSDTSRMASIIASRRSTPQFGPKAHRHSNSILDVDPLYGPSGTTAMWSHRMAQVAHPMIFLT